MLKAMTQPTNHHYLRSFVAGLFGAIALLLVTLSILVVWANRTLTDTNTYVHTVSPLIQQPQLQNFVADNVAKQLLASVSLPNLSSSLLGSSGANVPPTELNSKLTSAINAAVVQTMASPAIDQAWNSTNRSVQASLVSQIKAGQPVIQLDFGPLVSAVLGQMKQTKLAPLANQINLSPSSADVTLKGTPIEKIRQGYRILVVAPFVIVVLTLFFAGLSIWISVHTEDLEANADRRWCLTSLILAILIQLPVFIKTPTSSPAASQVALALVHTLLHGLQLALIVLGLVCIVVAVSSKFYERHRLKR